MNYCWVLLPLPQAKKTRHYSGVIVSIYKQSGGVRFHPPFIMRSQMLDNFAKSLVLATSFPLNSQPVIWAWEIQRKLFQECFRSASTPHFNLPLNTYDYELQEFLWAHIFQVETFVILHPSTLFSKRRQTHVIVSWEYLIPVHVFTRQLVTFLMPSGLKTTNTGWFRAPQVSQV